MQAYHAGTGTGVQCFCLLPCALDWVEWTNSKVELVLQYSREYMPKLEAWAGSLSSFRRHLTCNTSSHSLDSQGTQKGHPSSTLCHVDPHFRLQHNLSSNVHLRHKPAAEKAL